MKNIFRASALLLIATSVFLTSCDKDDDNPFEKLTYQQEDQMARPAINTVFVTTADKDDFNETIPSAQGGKYAAKFQDRKSVV